MPPKKRVGKTVNSEVKSNLEIEKDSSAESLVNKQNSIKPTMKKTTAVSFRTLRPRQILTPVEPLQPKTKKPPKTKRETYGDTSNKKLQSSKTKTTKNEKPSEEEGPAAKLSRIEVEEHNDDNGECVSASSIYKFKAKSIQGEDVLLSKYKGHVCIIVNVASKCGHTASNYKELVELYEKYSEEKGLRILAFPCNQFGKQEPGDNEKIFEFAKKKNVNFDMFEKIDVNGKNAHSLWKFLTSQKEGPKGAKIDWNFTKFLISKDGKVVERYKPAVKPLALVKDLEKLW